MFNLRWIQKNLNLFSYIILIIGIQDDGIFDSIPVSRLKSDRIEKIKNVLNNISHKSTYLLPIVNPSGGIVIVISGNF